MGITQFQKDRITKNIKCYHRKHKDENSYLIIYNDKYGVLFRTKGEESAFIISSEKLFLRSRSKDYKKISFKDLTKKMIAVIKKQGKTDIPADALGFTMLLTETVLDELKKVKPKEFKPSFHCHTCSGDLSATTSHES